MDAKAADRAFVELGIDIYFGMLGGVEGLAVVFDNQCEHTVGNIGGNLYMASHALGIGVVNDIGNPLFEGEIECLGGLVVDAMLATNGEEEGAKAANLGHLVLHDEAARVSRARLLQLAMAKEEHGEVVALLGAIGKNSYVLLEEIDYLDGRRTAVLLDIVKHAMLAKKLATAILREIGGLSESVGIKQQGAAWGKVELLLAIVITVFDANRQVGLDLKQTALTLRGDKHGGVVGGIAIG